MTWNNNCQEFSTQIFLSRALCEKFSPTHCSTSPLMETLKSAQLALQQQRQEEGSSGGTFWSLNVWVFSPLLQQSPQFR